MIDETYHLKIGSLVFEDIAQIDLTGPFEVLSRIPNAAHRIYANSTDPGRDLMGLRIIPHATLADAPQLDIRHVPGGRGQMALMEDEPSERASGGRKARHCAAPTSRHSSRTVASGNGSEP
jgi:cyclohexyl-isocyanide hydratase